MKNCSRSGILKLVVHTWPTPLFYNQFYTKGEPVPSSSWLLLSSSSSAIVWMFLLLTHWCSEWLLFSVGLQRESSMSNVSTIWMQHVGLCKGRDLLVNSGSLGSKLRSWIMFSWGRKAETALSLPQPFEIRAEEFWTIFTTLLSSVMQSIFSFLF